MDPRRLQTPPEMQISEEERAIMPDFPKWRTFFLKIEYMFVAAIFAVDLAISIFLTVTNKIEGSVPLFWILNMVIPNVLNLFIMFFFTGANRRLSDEDLRKNMFPILSMLLIATVVSIAFSHHIAAIFVYSIPICMTTIFTNRMLSRMAMTISIAGSTIAIIKQLIVGKDIWVLPEGLLFICLLVILGQVVKAALGMTSSQKQKLLNYAASIKQEQHRAEAANIAKSAFLANMSHEIRTPINAILGMNEMILRENDNEQIEEYAKSIDSAGNALLYLVNDVLDISKIESGKMEIVESDYDVSSFIHDCYNMISEKAAQKSLELIVDCNPQLPSSLRGDEARLRQVITNLLSNAAKYTKKGSVTLSFDFTQEEDVFTLIVTVKDTGVGIKKEDLDSLFTQFTRLDLQKNRNIEGTGLGLSLAKRLLDLMNGTIQVQSIYGVGSVFTVMIPQEVKDSTPMGDFRQHYREFTQGEVKYTQSFEAPGAHILVVDDVEVNLKVITNLLKKTKVQVDTASNGKQSLILAAEHKYDLIFMDHMMPEMNGVEAFTEMKKMENSLNKDTPVIMLTANAIAGVREQYLSIGFANYLSKPVRSEKLEEMILKHLPPEKIITVNKPITDTDKTASLEAAEITAGSDAASAGASSAGVVTGSAVGSAAASAGTATASAAASGNAGAQTAASAGNAVKISQPVPNNDPHLKALIAAYPNIDFAVGLSYCGDDADIYLSILQTFGEEDKTAAITEVYEKQDTPNYQILVHGVKSAALSIGFDVLSKTALSLESAAKENNWEFIHANHDAFMADYQNALDAIRANIPAEA